MTTGAIGVMVGFWAWVRGKINVQTAQIATLVGWKDVVEKRCEERSSMIKEVGDKVGRVHERIDDLVTCVGDKDSETAKAIGRLEGKLDGMKGR